MISKKWNDIVQLWCVLNRPLGHIGHNFSRSKPQVYRLCKKIALSSMPKSKKEKHRSVQAAMFATKKYFPFIT
jgi:hypothetical protein